MNTSSHQSQHGSQAGFSQLAAGQAVGAGRYRLKKILGQGGMGVVWLAQDQLLREPVALKFLPSQIVYDPSALDGLRLETRRSRKLSHPNIVRIHDLHDAQDEPAFISMELVEGPNLHTLRAQRPARVLPWTFLAPLMEQLAAALAYAHQQRVIHRDLKPANVMVDTQGRVKLADFGLARVISDSMSRITEGLHTSGTLAYMSPQQADGRKAHATDDLYSLGATLYELLAGTPPFHAGDIGYQLRHLPPEPLEVRLANSGLVNDIPSEVSSLVMACLAKDSDQRPQEARVVLDWLRAGNQQNPSGLVTDLPPSRSPSSTPLSPRPSAPASWPGPEEEKLAAHSSQAQHEQHESPTIPGALRFRSWMVGAACGVVALSLAGWQGWLPFFSTPTQTHPGLQNASQDLPEPARPAVEPSSVPALEEEGFAVIFNGRDLAGWEGDPEFWSVREGTITAFTAEEGIQRRRNTCLVWKEPVKDFELRLSFKLVDVIEAKPANSGVLYRSRKLEGFEYRGYQVDLHGQHTGKLLLLEGTLADSRTAWGHASRIKDDRGRAVIQSMGIVTDPGRFDAVIQKEDWNELVIQARGHRLTHIINGLVTMTAEDESSYCPGRSGALALELKRATVLQFKNIRLKHLHPDEPEPTRQPLAAASPGTRVP